MLGLPLIFYFMGMDVKLLVCLFVVWSLRSVAQRTETPSETPFLTCVNVEEKCRGALQSCWEIPISLTNTARDFPDNLLCIDNADLSTIYRLQGCPIGYFNTERNASGVCSIATADNGTDLLLTSNELVPGYHSFDCLVNGSLMVSNRAVVANDNTPYREVQVYINDVLQDRHNSTDFALHVGDNITVFVLAVGNVSMINASDPERFTCATEFPCSVQPRNQVGNRYRKCSLRTPANMSDDGRMLRITLDGMELTTINITMNERPLALPSKNDSQIIITTTTTTTAAVVSPTITQSVTDTAVVPVVTSSVTTVVAATTANVTAPVIPSIGHTTTGYNATPTVSATDKAPNRHSSFSGAVIAVITGLVSGCIALFGVLLVVYCKCKKTRVSKKSVGATAAVPHKVLSYSCRHCDELDKEIRASGYDIQKLSKNQSTGANTKDTCKVSLDENVPVIVCGHPECRAQHWLESSPMPENRNILQLYVAGDGDETPVQSNQRVKVISCADSDDGVPVNEVLHWLKSVSRRGSITSIDGQVLKLHELSKGVTELNRNVKLVAERTGEMLEKQDQTNTGIEMLHIDAQYERQE